jgi:hypothetical protein
LRLFVSAAKNSVQPGFPLFLLPGDLRAGAVRCNLHVFAEENRGGKNGGNVSFDRKPVVREVSHGCVDADGAGIEDRGLEAQPTRGKTQLPAVALAVAVEKLRLRRRHSRLGIVERQGQGRGDNGRCERVRRFRCRRVKRVGGGKVTEKSRLRGGSRGEILSSVRPVDI